MSYYFKLLGIIESLNGKKVTGRELHRVYFEKYSDGNLVNLNKALKGIRKRRDIGSERFEKTYLYWAKF